MEKSKLIEILFTCDTREKRLFRQWLLSPVHNLRTDVVQLYDYISEAKDLRKELVWQYLEPNTPFDDARMRQVMYFLAKQLDDFLTWQEIQADTSLLELSRLRVYRRRKLARHFQGTLEQVHKALDESSLRNGRYLRDLSMVELETYNFKSALKTEKHLNLQETSNALDLTYVAEKLRITCLMLSHQAVNREAQYHLGPIEELLKYIETHDLLEVPAVAAYYYCYYASVNKQNELQFAELQRVITLQHNCFPPTELRELYLFALNFCIYWINTGSKEYFKRAFELYQAGFESSVLIENGLISRFTFINAVVNALNVKEYQWAESFIAEFQQYLQAEHRTPTVQMAQARLYFEKGEYHKAQTVLHNYDSDDLLHVLYARVLLIKIYFMHQEFTPLESLLESTTAYLKRKKSLDRQRSLGYINFIKHVKKVVKLWPLTQKQRQEQIKAIEETGTMLSKNWLLEMLR
jgi:hypothetical protein